MFLRQQAQNDGTGKVGAASAALPQASPAMEKMPVPSLLRRDRVRNNCLVGSREFPVATYTLAGWQKNGDVSSDSIGGSGQEAVQARGQLSLDQKR
jgi:hypothetical protein